MPEQKWLVEQFEANRAHLRRVAYRMLGSQSEADDAVQEAWIRLGRADTSGVENLGGWLTTVVARVCLDMLRSRRSRREESLESRATESAVGGQAPGDPEQEAVLADSVGLALLAVLETLAPAERVAFVLHDMFDLPFDEIAPIVGRTPEAARQLASRARRRVRGAAAPPPTDRGRQREIGGHSSRRRAKGTSPGSWPCSTPTSYCGRTPRPCWGARRGRRPVRRSWRGRCAGPRRWRRRSPAALAGRSWRWWMARWGRCGRRAGGRVQSSGSQSRTG